MLTIQQIAYRDAQKYNSVPRSQRDDRIKDEINGTMGVPLEIYNEIKSQLGECTRENEREYARHYFKFCEQ